MSDNMSENPLLIIWEYIVSRGRENEFTEMYGPEGDWAKLFREAPGYIRTDLLIDKADPCRAVVMDWWETRGAYESFRRDFKAEYEAMNARAEMFNGSERLIGWFTREAAPQEKA